MKKLNFAIIGCGLISDVHATALIDISDAELLGAWDLDPKRAEEFCKKYSISPYDSLDSLLNDEKVDAVCICTPSIAHKEQAIAALKAGKHVVLEKPMSLCEKDAREVCDVAESRGRLLTVVSQTRFSEDVQKVKKLISENAFGKLCFCDLYMKYYRSPEYFSESPWRGRKKFDGGGALMNQGIHGIDLMRYLVGDAKLLQGRVKTLVHDIEVEDSAAAILEYDCGALGVIEGSTCASPGFRRRIVINGERGYVILSDTTIEKLYIDGKMLISQEIDPHPSTAASPKLASNELHKAQLLNFISAINKEAELIVTPYDGYYAVSLIESIYKSSENMN